MEFDCGIAGMAQVKLRNKVGVRVIEILDKHGFSESSTTARIGYDDLYVYLKCDVSPETLQQIEQVVEATVSEAMKIDRKLPEISWAVVIEDH